MDELIPQLVMVGLLFYLVTPSDELTRIRMKALHKRILLNRGLAQHYGEKVLNLEMAYIDLCEQSRTV